LIINQKYISEQKQKKERKKYYESIFSSSHHLNKNEKTKSKDLFKKKFHLQLKVESS
jgi:hypothetical protein